MLPKMNERSQHCIATVFFPSYLLVAVQLIACYGIKTNEILERMQSIYPCTVLVNKTMQQNKPKSRRKWGVNHKANPTFQTGLAVGTRNFGEER
jgi:hypothetical protein